MPTSKRKDSAAPASDPDSAAPKKAPAKAQKAAKEAKEAKEAKPAKPKAAKAETAAEPEAPDTAEDDAPLNRAERRALAHGKGGKSGAAAKSQAGPGAAVHPKTGPAHTQRQWSNRRSGG